MCLNLVWADGVLILVNIISFWSKVNACFSELLWGCGL